jgi:hypothetical protein
MKQNIAQKLGCIRRSHFAFSGAGPGVHWALGRNSGLKSGGGLGMLLSMQVARFVGAGP